MHGDDDRHGAEVVENDPENVDFRGDLDEEGRQQDGAAQDAKEAEHPVRRGLGSGQRMDHGSILRAGSAVLDGCSDTDYIRDGYIVN